MPTITDHLAASREQQTLANETPSHQYRQFVSYLLCALENLTDALDLLHQKLNATTQQEESHDNRYFQSRSH